MAICLLGVAAIFWSHHTRAMLLWCLVGFIGFFSFSQGAVIWVYHQRDLPDARASQGQSLGSSSHWIMNAIVSGLFPLFAKSSGASHSHFWPDDGGATLRCDVGLSGDQGSNVEQMQARLKIA